MFKMKRVKVKYGQNKISEKYEISEEGNIYELNNPNDVLKPYITTDGRKFCVLTEFDETRMFEIARLVAFSFGISSEGLTAGIRHKIEFINGDIADIRVDNIRWVDDPEDGLILVIWVLNTDYGTYRHMVEYMVHVTK